MKTFIIKLLAFFLLLIAADFAIGGIYSLYDHLKGGEIGKAHEIMTKVNPDILILGSSRAAHHYNPEILKEALQMQAYNAGFDGQGTFMDYGLLKGVSSRHKPKIIICELTPIFDIYQNAQSSSISVLTPYSSSYQLDTLFNDIDPNEKYKLLSNSYIYNSKLFRIIPNIISGRVDFINGYKPSHGTLDKHRFTPKGKEPAFAVDSLKVRYFKKLISKANELGATLIFTISPEYYNTESSEYYEKGFDIADERDIPILNHLHDPRFTGNPNLFIDPSHLNSQGADLFTTIIAHEVDSICKSR